MDAPRHDDESFVPCRRAVRNGPVVAPPRLPEGPDHEMIPTNDMGDGHGRRFAVGVLQLWLVECSDRQVWDEELRLARLAADLGFDVLWSVEHHFNDYCSVRITFI